MKLNFKQQNKQTEKTMKVIKASGSGSVMSTALVPKAVERFCDATSRLNKELVERTEEIDALRLCIAARQHLMLDGVHGTAKSKLSMSAFNMIAEGSEFSPVVFKKQFMKTTSAEEVTGPVDIGHYQSKAEWKCNVSGMLPSAHFAHLDEVYRASGSLLGSMFEILNERTYRNGAESIRCPLITAVGTTNFVTEDPELDAFHDRWLVRVKVNLIKSKENRIKMLTQFLDHENPETVPVKGPEVDPVTIEDIFIINRAVSGVSFNVETLNLYAMLVNDFTTKMRAAGKKDFFLSDRRICLALKLVQADALLRGKVVNKMAPAECLSAARFAFITVGEPVQEQAFTEVFGQVVGDYLSDIASQSIWSVFKTKSSKLLGSYDPRLSKSNKEDILNKARGVVRAYNENTDRPKSAALRDEVEILVRRLDTLAQEIADDLK